MDARVEVGERIAHARRRRGLAQSVLAGLIGRSESWLSQVERGKRSIDSHSVIEQLGRILDLAPDELVVGKNTLSARYEAASAIRKAMLGYDGLSALVNPRLFSGTPESLVWLRHEIRTVNRLYQATRYEEVGRRLPGLIVASELGCRYAPENQRRSYNTLRALTYHCVTSTLNRVEETELAWMAADRSLSAAEETARPVLVAVSTYRLGYVLVRLRQEETAIRLAEETAERLLRKGSDPRASAVAGGLYLVAVTAAASRYDHTSADGFLRRAQRVADLINEDRNDFWTAFGPSNVAIHEVSAAVDYGDARAAIKKGEVFADRHLMAGLVGRRAQIRIDLAAAYAMQRKDAASVNMLLEAEELSPELVRYGGRTRDLLGQLLKREHKASTPQLRGLARRAGVA
jgi:transcriptional regulator with XRE-family HTH domain